MSNSITEKPPEKAFILAAGKGTRLRPYTDSMPKPMVTVGGRSLIDRTLDKLEEAGVKHVVINLHYMADILREHLAERRTPSIEISYEEELLDTGGGVKKALPLLGEEPFYVIAGDALWTDGPEGNALLNLASKWNDDTMDIITYLQPLSTMTLTSSLGDYTLGDNGQAVRSLKKTGTHMWTNIRINHPRIFEDTPDGPFSFLQLLDKAQKNGRLHALEHQGEWHHISTAEDLERVDTAYRSEKRYA